MTFNLYFQRQILQRQILQRFEFFLNETSILAQFPLPPLKKKLIFEIWTKTGVMKKFSEIGGLIEKGGEVLLEREGGPTLFHQFSLRKVCCHCYRKFCLVNIHTWCNQQIYSFMWFTFNQKMIYYEISFPLTLIFNYNFVKIH